eukprot:COSAG04_NODE_1910_length_5250_cov_8.873617_2_plen_58_part_00
MVRSQQPRPFVSSARAKVPPSAQLAKCRGDKVVGYASVTDPIDKRTTGGRAQPWLSV